MWCVTQEKYIIIINNIKQIVVYYRLPQGGQKLLYRNILLLLSTLNQKHFFRNEGFDKKWFDYTQLLHFGFYFLGLAATTIAGSEGKYEV